MNLSEEQYDLLAKRVERLHKIECFNYTDEYILGLTDAQFEALWDEQDKKREELNQKIREQQIRDEEQDKQRRKDEEKEQEERVAEGHRIAQEALEEQQSNKKYQDAG
jgi:hypothetical protein